MRFDKALILVALLSLTGLAVSQPNLPHRIYGEVSSFETGSPITGANITFRNSSGSILATQNTSDTGFYDLNVELKDSGQRFFLFVDGVNTSESLRFSRGSSEALVCRFDSSSLSCVEIQDSDDADQEEDDQNQDQNDEQSSDDQESGGGSSGGSGGGSSGGGGSGGGGSPSGGFGGTGQEQDEPPENENITVELQLDKKGSATARIENLSEGQEVNVNTEGTSFVRGLNFVSDQKFSKSIISFNSSLVSVANTNITMLETVGIESENISSSESLLLGFEIEKFPISGNNTTSKDFALFKGQENLSEIELSVTEGLRRYLFEADVDNIDGIYQFGYFNKSSPKQGIEVKNLTTSSSGEKMVLSIRVKNSANTELVDSVRLIKNKSTVKEWRVELKPYSEKILNYSVELDKGSHIFSVRGQKAEVNISDSAATLPLLMIGGLISILSLFISYLYLSGIRKASQLDRTIERLEKRGEGVDEEMKSLRDDLRRIRTRVKHSGNNYERNS
ncbi:hypothetical protein GLU26_01935 [Nanohaloarchaea archaeon]|nr:hypothetical protein [Candidatus Nanohaloarchaea archaeon]